MSRGEDAAICGACGVARAARAATCPVCADERQYVPAATGQTWTTPDALRAAHHNELVELEPDLWSIRTAPAFAIAQHALLVRTPEGNVLWDCVSLLDDATVAAVTARGGLAAIAISHPHFHASMRAWSEAFGGVPIHIHAGDAAWVAGHGANVRPWSGTSPALPGGLALVHVGGHFSGSQVLWWPAGAGGRGALLVADMPNVCSDRRWVSFMRSYPNQIPLGAPAAARVVAALHPLACDRLYGWTPERVVAHGAQACLERSLERHARALTGEHDAVAADD